MRLVSLALALAMGTPPPVAPLAPAMGVEAPCVGGKPALLTVDLYDDLSLPVEDPWQVMWNEVPLSDAQLAWLADDDDLLSNIREELDHRGPWVFAGMLTAAAGTAVSSTGWALMGGAGGNNLSNAATLSMALGGLLLGMAGVLLVGDFVQTPLEPFMAPSPSHRLMREHARDLVGRVNERLMRNTCPPAAPSPSGQTP